MLNKQDVRYLLIDESWPKDYSDPQLYITADAILKEMETLKGDGLYKKHIKDQDIEINTDITIKILSGLLYLYNVNKVIAEETQKELGRKYSKYKNVEQIEKALNNRLFDKDVEAEKAKGKKSKNKETTFEQICLPVEKYLKRDLDKDITVAKFIAWENDLKLSIKEA